MEVDKRVAQVTAAWCELGHFWTSDAPAAAKRSTFIGSIQGTALSGITSYVLTAGDRKRLDTKLVGLLRCMMMGAAYDEQKKRSMTKSQLYAHWRMLPVELELMVREVK